MRNLILTLLFCCLAGFVTAQSVVDPRPSAMIELRDLSLMLELSKDQVGILKDYFAQSLKDEREELLPMTDNRDVQLTKGKYQKDRDDKIMSLLSEKQQPLFVAYLREKERGTIALPTETEEGGKR